MDDEKKPNPSLLKLANQVASMERGSAANLSFKEWMREKRKTSRADPPAPPSMKVQPFLRLPTSLPPRLGLLMDIKDEPWQGPAQLPSTNKLQPPSNETKKHTLPFSRGDPIHIKTRSPKPTSRPNPNLTIQNHGDHGLKFLPKTGIPTRPRSSLKRKAMDDEQPQKLPSSVSKKSAESLLCYLCHISCSSALTMNQHLEGRPHKAKMEYMRMKRDAGPRGGSPRCELCAIWCSDVPSLEMHFKGQKHKSKVREFELRRERGGENSSKAPIICEVCCVPCMNEELFQAHLKGRQHASKQGLKRI